eukprot:CAMPEP_0185025254 /NCGR_PEP_ID=MMETSP1103-20130426/8279_1 /TAXON_ID=36769 /ORGANISM="Paraphysomonas bandaiensis, Strain Caron Lab Isolate" /LENGTH=235 /DNA_ID=CAMNT_0027558407 /DNA_START=25 /DNA_END=732 /DNA_ORIENTATION=+
MTFTVEPNTRIGNTHNTARHTDSITDSMNARMRSYEEMNMNEVGNYTFTLPHLIMRLCLDLHWDPHFAEEATGEYIRLIEMKCVSRDIDGKILSPSPIIDQVWHTHILDTRAYMKDTEIIHRRVAGDQQFEFLHHSPDNAQDVDERRRRLKNTKRVYRASYAERMDEKYWAENATVTYFSPPLSLKEMVRNEEGIPCNQQRLIFRDVNLDDSRMLSDYNITHESSIRLVLKLIGC